MYDLNHQQQSEVNFSLRRWLAVLRELRERADLGSWSYFELGWTAELRDALPGDDIASLSALDEPAATALWSRLEESRIPLYELFTEVEDLASMPLAMSTEDWATRCRERGIVVVPADYVSDGPITASQALASIIRSHIEEKFTERSWFVLQHRHSLLSSELLTLQAIGDKFGVTRERIRQQQVQASRELERWLANPGASLHPARLHPEIARTLMLNNALLDEITANPMAEDDFIARATVIWGDGAGSLPAMARMLASLRGLAPLRIRGLQPIWTRDEEPHMANISVHLRQIHETMTKRSAKPCSFDELVEEINRHYRPTKTTTLADITPLVPLVNSVEVLPDGRVQGRLGRLFGRKLQVEQVLNEAGKPLHLSTIRDLVNQELADAGRRRLTKVNLSNQLSASSKFIPLGRSGFWGLSEWPGLESRTVRELMVRCLLEYDRPLTHPEVYRWVSGRRPVSAASISTYLHNDSLFSRVGSDLWGLAHWEDSGPVEDWTAIEVSTFLLELFETHDTDNLPLDEIRDDFQVEALVGTAKAEELLTSCPILEIRRGAGGKRHGYLRSDSRLHLLGSMPRWKTGRAAPKVLALAETVLRDRPDRQMPLVELRDIIARELKLPNGTIYSCISDIEQLDTWWSPDRVGKFVRWVGPPRQ